jgi:hypothetical protein
LEILEYIFSGRNGVQNTSFALLDPKGTKLSRGGRSPKMIYGTAEAFVEALQKTGKKYSAKAKAIKALPTVRNLRLALNVAAADMRPLIIVRGKDAKGAAKLEKLVAKVSWAKDFVGTCHFVVLNEKTTFEGLTPPLGVSLVQPDPYGLGAKTLMKLTPSVTESQLKKALKKALAKYEVASREHRDHIREARRKGIEWKPETEVTDKGGQRRR